MSAQPTDQQEQPFDEWLAEAEERHRTAAPSALRTAIVFRDRRRALREIRRLQAELKGWESLGRTQRQALECAEHNEAVWKRRAELVEAENASLREQLKTAHALDRTYGKVT